MDTFKMSTMLCVVLIVAMVIPGSVVAVSKYVTEVNKGMFEEYLKGKLFVLTYVDSPSCKRCRNLFPFFVSASQAFPNDNDIFFSRTFDKQLILEWDIQELPALVYHKKDADSLNSFGTRGVLSVDVTVDDVVKAIEETLHGDFDNIKKKYAIGLNRDNFDEMVTTPSQSVMILLYDKASRKETIPVIESVAYAFRKDDGVIFGTLNVDKYADVRDARFKSRDTPRLMWLAEQDKSSSKRFGGAISTEIVTIFINERTGLNRMSTGALHREAGRIAAVDALLEEHADLVYKAEPESSALLIEAILEKKPNVLEHQVEMLEYYVEVLKQLSEGEKAYDVLEDIVLNLQAKLYGDEDIGTKATELVKRQKNVVHQFQYCIKIFRTGEWQRPASSTDDGSVDSRITLGHTHVHTEL